MRRMRSTEQETAAARSGELPPPGISLRLTFFLVSWWNQLFGRGRSASDSPRKVLLIRRGYIGDVIQSTALLADVRARYPGAEIAYMTGPAGAEVLRGNPSVDRLIGYVEPPGRKPGGYRETGRALRNLRGERFDLGLCLSHNSWDALLLRLAGVGRAAGFAEPGREFLLDLAVTWDERESRPSQEHYDDLLRGLGIEPRAREYYLAVGPAGEDLWRRLLPELELTRAPLLALAPGGGRHPQGCAPYRQWAPERFAAVAEALIRQEEAEVCLVGDAEDREVARQVQETLPSALRGRVHDLTGQTSLGELAALLSRARLLIANDSAPVWIAAAVSCPVVAIFGCNDPVNHRPLARRYAAVGGRARCHPCFSGAGVPSCSLPPECLDSLRAEEVVAVARQLLRDEGEPEAARAGEVERLQ